MTGKNNFIKFIIKLWLILIGSFFLFLNLKAQNNPEIIITWRANNFYPSDFQGKALATNYTPISIAVEAIKDKKLLDLSQFQITWYLNNRFFIQGNGFKEINYPIDPFVITEESLPVRVVIEGKDLSSETRINIPIDSPLVILENSYNKTFESGESVLLTALPYFFNVNSFYDLNFSWVINKIPADRNSYNKNKIILNLGDLRFGSFNRLLIELTVENSSNPLELVKERYGFNVSSEFTRPPEFYIPY